MLKRIICVTTFEPPSVVFVLSLPFVYYGYFGRLPKTAVTLHIRWTTLPPLRCLFSLSPPHPPFDGSFLRAPRSGPPLENCLDGMLPSFLFQRVSFLPPPRRTGRLLWMMVEVRLRKLCLPPLPISLREPTRSLSRSSFAYSLVFAP